jgi:hypothetical protein
MGCGKKGNNHGLIEIPLWDLPVTTEENHK